MNKVIQMGGKKIAYLMYTKFSQGFDKELNSVFAEFKSEGVDELILDLRYNRGGLTKTFIFKWNDYRTIYRADFFSESYGIKKSWIITSQLTALIG